MPQELGLALGSWPEVESPPAGELVVGDFVWGKIKSHPWWPGRVFDPSEASDQARKAPRKDQSSVLVAYFGDDSFAWCNPSQLKPFFENFEQMASSGGSKSFRAALDSAVSEIGKILEAELSCNCLPEEERSGNGKYLGKSGKISNFSAEEFLGLLKDVAVDVSVVNVLETAKLRSWVVAFQRGLNVGHKRKAIADLVDKIDLDVPAAEAVEGPDFLNGPEILLEKSSRGRKKRSMAVLIAQMDLDSVEVSDGEEEANESGKDLEVDNGNVGSDVKEEEVGSGRRERKKSKYLSPPYTYLSGGFAKTLVSPKSSESKTLRSPRGLSFGSSAAVVKCSTEGMYKEEEEKGDPLFQVDGVDVAEVLSEFLATAVNPLYLKWSRSAKVVRGFFAEFRSSLFSNGAKFDAYKKQVAESPGAENKVEKKEVGVKSEEGKQTERKRGRKLKAVVTGDGETPIDKSDEGKKTQGKGERKRKDMVNVDGETPINKSEEVKQTVGKRGRKRNDKVNVQGETPIDLSHQTSEHSEKKDEAASKMNTMEEGANGEAPMTPKRQKATGLENGTSGRKRGRKKADATQNITVNSGCETVNNVGFGKTEQEPTKGEEKKSPTELDIEGCSQMKEAIMGQKRKKSKNGPIVDVPVNLEGRVTNGSGEGKPRRKKNKNSTGNEDPAAVLLTFSTEITLPSKEDLISAFSKYGPVIQSETEVVKESSSAKVVFGRSSDAEKAFNDKVAALGLPVASCRLRYLTGTLSSPSSATPISVPKPPLPYIRKSLERMISTLSRPAVEKVVGTEALKPETRDNLVGEMQGLLMKVDKMLTGPAAGTSS